MKRLRATAALAACSSLFFVFAGCRQILGWKIDLNLGGGVIQNKGEYDMFLVKYRQ